MGRYIDQKIKKHLKVDSLNKPIGEEQIIELQDLIEDDGISIEDLIKTKIENEELKKEIKNIASSKIRKCYIFITILN